MDIKELLKSGTKSADEMRKELDEQIAAAEAELAKEEAEERAKKRELYDICLETSRADLIDALLTYLTDLGFLDEDEEITDEDIQHLTNAFKSLEKDVIAAEEASDDHHFSFFHNAKISPREFDILTELINDWIL